MMCNRDVDKSLGYNIALRLLGGPPTLGRCPFQTLRRPSLFPHPYRLHRAGTRGLCIRPPSYSYRMPYG